VGELSLGQHSISFRAAFSSQPRTAFGFAWFFVIFASTHFLLDSAAFNQFPESSYSLLYGFLVSYQQLYHCPSKRTINFTLVLLIIRSLAQERFFPKWEWALRSPQRYRGTNQFSGILSIMSRAKSELCEKSNANQPI